MDEPTAGVDPSARRDFWDEVHRLAAEGITALISTHYMDEAERCHRLAYIAYGNLLASGTVEDLIENSGLITWHVVGKDMHKLSEKLKSLSGIEQVVAFGNTLHISGVNQKELEASINPYVNGLYQWKKADTNLEEVFIHLMQKVKNH